MKRKVFGAVLSIILASLVFLNGINLPVYAQEPPDMVHSISNGFVRFSVLAQNGRFSIKTSAGAANRDDSNQKLLYEDKKPETSFTSFWIDGKEYIYGNSYGFMGLDGTFTAPATVGKTNTSVWKIGAVEVTQSLVLLEDKDNPNVGNVRITYQVKNLSEKGDVKVGTRILLDTMLGSNDGAPIFIPGTQQPVETEIELKDDNIPQYWRGADNSFAPKVVSYGFTEGWGNLSPDKMVIGHWSGLSQSKWQYTPDDSLAFSGTDNPYGTADSAVALYWNPVSIGAGQTQVFETYYGIGNFSNINDRAKYGLTVNAPEKLVINDNKTGYLEDTFTITAELDNSLAGASNLTNVTASLILGDGLVLVPDEAQVPYATQQVIYKNTVQTFTWKVKAEKSEAYTTRRYRVDINCDNHTDPFSKDGYILLPGILGEPPQTQFLGVSPSKLYMDGAKSFTIKGKGFDIYMNKALWRMELVDSKGNIALQIPRAAINVGLEAITVNFDANLPRGSYSIRLKHDEPSVADETLKTKLEMTADKKFMSKTYGVLFVRKTETDGDYTYTLEIAQDEKELTQIEESLFSNEEIILDIKGVIRETEEQGSKVYRVFEKALLNSVLQYEGEPLVIQKVDDNQDVDGEDTIQISGDGTLTMENGFSFWFCEFESSIADGENYMTELADEDDGECNIELEFTGIGKVAKWIAGFAIQIENAVLLKRGISLGGGINITLPNMNKEHEVDDDEDEFPGISAEISNVLYGMKGESNDFGFIGIDFTTSLKAPEDMIPITWIQKGFEMTLTINTIDDLFSFEGEADIKICEANVNLTFIKNQASGWWLPDDFVIAAGFDPGFPLGPTGIFLNKVGGGVEDLFGTITGDGSLPPLQVILIAGLNFAEVIEVEAKLSISKNGFVFEGE
ncbi:MAG: hypothetical protein GX115_11045 [Ruminiclostridium sp.]|nr:hypothetical protein [Ruminiclostridium sp.]